jgi:hypothetical protein
VRISSYKYEICFWYYEIWLFWNRRMGFSEQSQLLRLQKITADTPTDETHGHFYYTKTIIWWYTHLDDVFFSSKYCCFSFCLLSELWWVLRSSFIFLIFNTHVQFHKYFQLFKCICICIDFFFFLIQKRRLL